MLSADAVLSRTRPVLCALVDRERSRSGSKMTAYARVAAKIGVTASWVRKLIGRQPIGLEAHVYLNIHAAYVRMCERIEAENDHTRQLLAVLEEQSHEALEGFDHPMAAPSPHVRQVPSRRP